MRDAMRSQRLTIQDGFKKPKDLFSENEFARIGIKKRKMERFFLELPIYLTVNRSNSKQGILKLQTSNVCADGAFVKTDEPLSIGTKVDIRMILSLEKLTKFRGKKSLINVSGVVIRTDQRGMAIRFDNKFKISPCEM
jgi:NAD(P)H-flavin reductase